MVRLTFSVRHRPWTRYLTFAISMSLSLSLAISANAFAVASSPYAAIPLVRDDTAGDMPVAARVIIVLLALLAPLAWWLRRRRGSTGPRFSFMTGMGKRDGSGATPVVRSVTRLNSATALYVVEWQSQSLLISCAGDQVNVLERSPLATAEPARPDDKEPR